MAAAALAVAQLLVLLLMPAVHQTELAASLTAHVQHVVEAGTAQHTERPSSKSGHQETACQICRVAELRYAAPAPWLRPLAVADHAARVAPVERESAGRPIPPGTPGPRAPPLT